MKSLTEGLLDSIRAVRGRRMNEEEEPKKPSEHELPSEDDADGEYSEEDAGFEAGEDEGGEDTDFEDVDEGGSEDEEIPSLEDDSDIPPEFDEGGEEGDLEPGEMDELPDGTPNPDELMGDEPPPQETEPFSDEQDGGLQRSSDFTQFITNQLIDFPVEDVQFVEEDGARYVDAKFGDKAVSFCLYTGEEGQPLLAMLHDNEVYRIELPPEAMTGEGQVRDEFMPIEWIKDNMARIVDTAPEFECYRLKKATSNCNETRKTSRKTNKSWKLSEACNAIKRKPMGKPKTVSKKKVVKGGNTKGKKAPLGGDKIKPATKAGGKVVLK